MTTVMAESEEELKNLLMKGKESEKVGLKLNILKTKIMFLRICWIPKHGFLWYRNKQTYFTLAKIYWL